MNTTPDPLSEATIMGANESENVSPKLDLDQQIPESGAIQQIPENKAMNVSSELDMGTGNTSSGLESAPTQGASEVYTPISNVSDMTQISSIPHEGLTPAGGLHGLYDTLSLHPGVWFLFGCIFIVFLMIVREVYYKKKS
jgi:hypothetical protein